MSTRASGTGNEMTARIHSFRLEPGRCLFCGSDETSCIFQFSDLCGAPRFFVYCFSCQARGPLASRRRIAIETWNRLGELEGGGKEGDILRGWKEIEGYLGQTRKTILAGGYPLHRSGSGEASSQLYAFRSELDGFMKSHQRK